MSNNLHSLCTYVENSRLIIFCSFLVPFRISSQFVVRSSSIGSAERHKILFMCRMKKFWSNYRLDCDISFYCHAHLIWLDIFFFRVVVFDSFENLQYYRTFSAVICVTRQGWWTGNEIYNVEVDYSAIFFFVEAHVFDNLITCWQWKELWFVETFGNLVISENLLNLIF